jgi:hypothetical protein
LVSTISRASLDERAGQTSEEAYSLGDEDKNVS